MLNQITDIALKAETKNLLFIIFKIDKLYLGWSCSLLLSFPDKNREEENRDDNKRTHRTEWAEYADDDFLRDDISIE